MSRHLHTSFLAGGGFEGAEDVEQLGACSQLWTAALGIQHSIAFVDIAAGASSNRRGAGWRTAGLSALSDHGSGSSRKCWRVALQPFASGHPPCRRLAIDVVSDARSAEVVGCASGPPFSRHRVGWAGNYARRAGEQLVRRVGPWAVSSSNRAGRWLVRPLSGQKVRRKQCWCSVCQLDAVQEADDHVDDAERVATTRARIQDPLGPQHPHV